jgi:hypothetical protein
VEKSGEEWRRVEWREDTMLLTMLYSPTPLMDYSLLASNLSLTAALFLSKHSTQQQPSASSSSSSSYPLIIILCGGSFIFNLVTTLIVHFRIKANLPRDKMQGFPIYDKWRLYAACLVSIASFFPAMLISLTCWLDSEVCWWIAATTLVVTHFVLLDTMKDGRNRVLDAEKMIKDGFTWKDNDNKGKERQQQGKKID